MAYNVVFEYTEETGGYAGVRTWTSFRSEEAFKEWYTPDLQKRQRIFDEGVTPDDAVKLIRQTPARCYVASCLEEATDQKTGEVDVGILEMHLSNVLLATQFIRHNE